MIISGNKGGHSIVVAVSLAGAEHWNLVPMIALHSVSSYAYSLQPVENEL